MSAVVFTLVFFTVTGFLYWTIDALSRGLIFRPKLYKRYQRNWRGCIVKVRSGIHHGKILQFQRMEKTGRTWRMKLKYLKNGNILYWDPKETSKLQVLVREDTDRGILKLIKWS